MRDAQVFDCPSCGAKLATDGTQVQITCEYCGSVVTVPQELRVQPLAPANAPAPKEQLAEAFINLAVAAAAERAAEGQAQVQGRPVTPPARRSRFGGCGCLLVLLILGAVIALASGIIPGTHVPPQVREVLGISVPTPTPVPVSRPLQDTLPRDVRYANLDFKVTGATVTNRVPSNSSQALNFSSDQAYAELDMLITNPLTTKSVYVESGLPKLLLADGKTYPESSRWAGNFDKQSNSDARLVFTVPYSATLKGSKLVLQQAGKEPATLPLDGPAPVAQFPIKLTAGEHATAGTVNYTVLSAAVDLDANGERTDAGKRFLVLKMRVENTSDFRGGMALGGDYFRLLVDGVPAAPVVFPIELIDAKSAIDGDVVFVVPDTATKADLQVGEVGQEQTATIPLSLKGGK